MKGDYQLSPGLNREIAGHYVLSSCVGRMSQALDSRHKAQNFQGTPLITAPTSWRYFSWMLEYDSSDNIDSGRREDMHIVHALTSESERLEWLGKVPVETILEIRKNGLANDVREILGKGIGSLVKINPDNYLRTANTVVDNLDQAFRKHQDKIQEAKANRLKFYGIDVGSCVAVGGIAVAAAVTANPVLGAVSGLLGVAGAANLREIRSKYAELKQKESEIERTPTGLLFRHIR